MASNNQQKNLEKTLPNVVVTITNLIGLLHKIPKVIASQSGKTTVVPTATTTTISQLQEKLQNNLKQIQDSLTLLQKFEESELAERLNTQLRALEDLLKPEEKKPSFSDINNINKELMKLKYQIPSIRKQAVTSSRAHSQTSSGSNEGSSVQVLHMLRESESFLGSSFCNEIEEIFSDLNKEKRFILSCFAVLTEHAVVKRRLLTYWALGEGHFLCDSKSPEEIVDGILLDFKEMGLIQPAINKRKQEVRSYKMDPLVRSALMNIFQKTELFTFDSNGNVMGNCPTAKGKKAFLVKGKEKEKLSDKALEKSKASQQQGEQQSWLDPEELVTLFNVNELSPDTKLSDLAKKKSKDVKVVDWLSKMKSLQVLYLGRWQKSAGYHIEVKDTAFLKGLKSMEKLKFLSLQGISRINKLPPFISMLKNLVVLDLKDCYNLEVLSEDISSLTSLRYLDISNCYLLGNMPKKLSSLSELEVLKGFIIGDPRRGKLGTLEDLKGLKKLKKLTIIATRKDFPTPEDLGALQKLEALRKLTIAWGVQPKNSEEQAKAGELSKHETSLFGKEAESSERPINKLPNKLKKLDLQCFPCSTPTWLTPDDLPNLGKLYIRGGNFTTLKKGKWKVEALRLKYLREMKTNWRELKELFPDLVYLERVKCPGITLCPCDENGVWQKSENIKCSCDQYQ